MPNIGPVELVIILVIALLILGPGRLPDVGSALGKSIREFRKAATDVQDAVKVDAPPPAAAAPVAQAPAAAPPAVAPAPNTLAAAAAPNVLATPGPVDVPAPAADVPPPATDATEPVAASPEAQV